MTTHFAMLERLKQQNADLFDAARDWILDGWEYSGGPENITPLMIAAALEKEAATQDACVEDDESDCEYPGRLRRLAALIASIEVDRLREGWAIPGETE